MALYLSSVVYHTVSHYKLLFGVVPSESEKVLGVQLRSIRFEAEFDPYVLIGKRSKSRSM
jgi:hypothetical protein